MDSNSKELFLSELRSEYNAQFDLMKSLEAKSGQLITVCGIVIPLLFGFSSFVIDKNFDNRLPIYTVEIILVIILTLTAASIFFSAWALRIQIYRHAFLPTLFFTKGKNPKNQKLKEEEINEFGQKDSEQIFDILIKEYLLSNNQNLFQNYNKARKIQIAQYLFLAGLALVPILVAILFSFPPIRT